MRGDNQTTIDVAIDVSHKMQLYKISITENMNLLCFHVKW